MCNLIPAPTPPCLIRIFLLYPIHWISVLSMRSSVKFSYLTCKVAKAHFKTLEIFHNIFLIKKVQVISSAEIKFHVILNEIHYGLQLQILVFILMVLKEIKYISCSLHSAFMKRWHLILTPNGLEKSDIRMSWGPYNQSFMHYQKFKICLWP